MNIPIIDQTKPNQTKNGLYLPTIKTMSTFCDIVCSPAMIGVGGVAAIAFVANTCCGSGDAVNSKSLMDFTPIIFNPNAEVQC